MKILIMTDSRGMWPREYSWTNVLKQATNNQHEIHEYIGGIHNWLISIHMMEEYVEKNFADGSLDLIILQAGWHEGGACPWTREVWKEITKEKFKEEALKDSINHKGTSKYLYIDRDTEKSIFKTFQKKAKRLLFVGMHSLRPAGNNDLHKEFNLGMKHHYDTLAANESFSIEGADSFNLPMSDEWASEHMLPDKIHFNYKGVNFLVSYLAKYIQTVNLTIKDFLSQNPKNKDLYNSSLQFGGGISKITKAGDRVLIANRFLENAVDMFVGCILYGRVPVFIQSPSSKVFESEFKDKMERIKSLINPSLCICGKEDEESFKSFFQTTSSISKEQVDQVDIKTDDIAFIQLSSGTTGNAKILEVTHKQVIENCIGYGIKIKLNGDSVINSWLPLYHDMGLITSVFLPIIFGAKSFIMDPFEWVRKPDNIIIEIEKTKGTHVWMPNFSLKHISKSISDNKVFDLASLVNVISCSEPTFLEDVVEFKRKLKLKDGTISNCYALAENVFAVTQSEGIKTRDCDDFKNVVSCGKPIEGVSVIIVKNGEDITQTGESGEIHIKSDTIPKNITDRKYYGYYNTGDIGFFNEAELYVIGRGGDSFVSFGENVHPHVVESEVSKVNGVAGGRVACYGIFDPKIGTNKVSIVAEVEDISKANEIALLILSRIKGEFGFSTTVNIKEKNYIIKTSSGKVSRSRTKAKILGESNGIELLVNTTNDFLKEKNKNIQVTIKDRLYSSGILDSLEILELLLYLEKFGFITEKDKLTKDSPKINLEMIDTLEQILSYRKEYEKI